MKHRRRLANRIRNATSTAIVLVVTCGLTAREARAAGVDYVIDDGSAERAIGIDAGEDSLWFNTFPVQPGGEVIHSISVAFGRPGISQVLNDLPIKILLYEDTDGGLPWNAALKQSLDATSANANTNTLNVYEFTPTEIHGTLLAAVLFRNTTGLNKSISAFDLTAPTLPNRSFYGYAVGLNENDLSSIPAGQFGTIESLGQIGNWVLRASGSPIPEPRGALLLLLGAAGIVTAARPRRAPFSVSRT
jgi:hypothetical protein